MNKLISLTQRQEIAFINIINMANRTLGDGLTLQFSEIHSLITQQGFNPASIEFIENYLAAKKDPGPVEMQAAN